jgi:hypothetical protein
VRSLMCIMRKGDRCGSFATDAVKGGYRSISAVPRKRDMNLKIEFRPDVPIFGLKITAVTAPRFATIVTRGKDDAWS